MGILNCTPDSFFDGGRYFDEKAAIRRGLEMVEEGADIIDIGGESTRPGAKEVSIEEELRRVIPVIKALKDHPISIDTCKPEVAEKALEAGATLINDVTGFRQPEMRQIAAEAEVPVCVMHMQGSPRTMQHSPSYPKGVVTELTEWFEKTTQRLLADGVKAEQIILDPGIGFGKTVEHNLEILSNLATFRKLGFPLLIGLSRKSFMSKMINLNFGLSSSDSEDFTSQISGFSAKVNGQRPFAKQKSTGDVRKIPEGEGEKPEVQVINKRSIDLLSTSLAINTMCILEGVAIVRVHDIKEHREMIDVIGKLS